MSKTSATIAIIMGAVIICLSLWVKGLKADIVHKDDTIALQKKDIDAKDKANKELSEANTALNNNLATERKASADRAATIAKLKEQLADKQGKYDKATEKDVCANTRAPDDVISLMQ